MCISSVLKKTKLGGRVGGGASATGEEFVSCPGAEERKRVDEKFGSGQEAGREPAVRQ